MAGVLDETSGKGKTDGVEPMLDRIVERKLLMDLGHQLGQGLTAGATEITPEQRMELERTIDALLLVATARAAKGLRGDVSPALRDMVTRDIVGAFSDGLRGELGPTLEETVDRVVTRSIVALRRNLAEDESRTVTADLLRESIYIAMREGRPGTPAVTETLEFTLQDAILAPFEGSVGGLVEVVASRVDESARRTENTLKAIIGALAIVLGAVVLLYWVSQQRLQRERQSSEAREADLRQFDAALALLDDETRKSILGRAQDQHRTSGRRSTPTDAPATPRDRGDDYLR